MNALAIVAVSAAAAFGARQLATALRAAPEVRHDEVHVLLGLRQSVAALRAEQGALAAELERRAAPLLQAAQPVAGVDEAALGEAVARWRAAHPAEAEQANRAQQAAPMEPSELDDLASVPMDELVRLLHRSGIVETERQELFQRLRDSGRIAEYVAAVEALAAADPTNPDLQVALGHAYLQQLFGVGNSPEAGPLAFKSDAAFDRALALDDTNWGARFSKAVSLSNWPAFLGRGPEAIEHFEILLEQQATMESRPEFAMTYLFLGNMQLASGDREAARETWGAGLAQFPDSTGLQEALETSAQE